MPLPRPQIIPRLSLSCVKVTRVHTTPSDTPDALIIMHQNDDRANLEDGCHMVSPGLEHTREHRHAGEVPRRRVVNHRTASFPRQPARSGQFCGASEAVVDASTSRNHQIVSKFPQLRHHHRNQDTYTGEARAQKHGSLQFCF